MNTPNNQQGQCTNHGAFTFSGDNGKVFCSECGEYIGMEGKSEPATQPTPEGISPEDNLSIIHKGIEFARTLFTDSESYKSGAAFGYSCGYQAASLSRQPSAATEEGKEILREVVMRSNLCFPETEQDLDWFNEGLAKQHDLFLRISETLSLGVIDEDKIPPKLDSNPKAFKP